MTETQVILSVRDFMAVLALLGTIAGMWTRMEIRHAKFDSRLNNVEKAVNGGGRSRGTRGPRRGMRKARR